MALTSNVRCHFESRWVYQKVLSFPSIFTKGVEELYLPVRRGEGNFIKSGGGRPFYPFPSSASICHFTRRSSRALPRKSQWLLHAIAGICDPTGRILGLMPHPEAAIFFTSSRIRGGKLKQQLPFPCMVLDLLYSLMQSII